VAIREICRSARIFIRRQTCSHCFDQSADRGLPVGLWDVQGRNPREGCPLCSSSQTSGVQRRSPASRCDPEVARAHERAPRWQAHSGTARRNSPIWQILDAMAATSARTLGRQRRCPVHESELVLGLPASRGRPVACLRLGGLLRFDPEVRAFARGELPSPKVLPFPGSPSGKNG
jgi:hypothetical protein